MTGHRKVFQEDLFGYSRAEELRRRVKELDDLIATSMKKNDYSKARELTKEQEKIIQELVDLGDQQ
jgi:hypothetical protein